MISIIIPCKNRLNHLAETILLTRKLEGEYEIIITDYNCPMGCADYIDATFSSDTRIKVVRAAVGEKDWSLSHARNLGYKVSSGDAMLFIDADTKVKSDFLVKHPLNEKEFYTGHWLHASGCCLIWRSDFEKVRGFNEVIQSWGSEDYDLYRRLEGLGLKRNYFDKKSFENIRHHNRTRNEYHNREDIHSSNEKNYQASIKEFRSCIG